jgi:hypothetical protein
MSIEFWTACCRTLGLKSGDVLTTGSSSNGATSITNKDNGLLAARRSVLRAAMCLRLAAVAMQQQALQIRTTVSNFQTF